MLFAGSGAGVGSAPLVRAHDGDTGVVAFTVAAYEAGFTGGVNVAAADLIADSVPDLVTGPGAGGGPRVRAFDLASGEPAIARGFFTNFLAADADDRDGAAVAVGDVNGDLIPDVIAGPAAGAAGRVKVFNGFDGSVMSAFDAFPGGAAGGVRVAGFYLTADRYADVAVAAGDGRVAVFDAGTGKVVAGPLAGVTPFGVGVGVTVAAANDPGSYLTAAVATLSSAAVVSGQTFTVSGCITGHSYFEQGEGKLGGGGGEVYGTGRSRRGRSRSTRWRRAS